MKMRHICSGNSYHAAYMAHLVKPKSVIRKNFLSFLMTAIRKLALYKLDL